MAKERAQWTGRLGFVLAAAGSAIGLGNLWKFPYITYENNGGAFVLVYLGAIALVGVPIMVAEIVLGRRSQKNAVGAFRVLAQGKAGGQLWQGVGFLGVMTGSVTNKDTTAVTDCCEQVIDFRILILGQQRGGMHQNRNDNKKRKLHKA